MNEMKDWGWINAVVDNEGFDYAFMCYSDFDDIKDLEFHKLRKEYINAHEKLQSYIEKKTQEESE